MMITILFNDARIDLKVGIRDKSVEPGTIRPDLALIVSYRTTFYLSDGHTKVKCGDTTILLLYGIIPTVGSECFGPRNRRVGSTSRCSSYP